MLAHLLLPRLGKQGERRIEDLTYLSPEQRVPVSELKLSIVDVKCRDHAQREYVVEMQILNVENLEVIPPELAQEPFRTALEQARTAGFSSAEWDAYDRAKIAEQDARGAITFAERQGRAEGLTMGLRRSIEEVCELLEIPLDPSRRAEIETLSREQLETLPARLKRERRWD